MDSEIIHLANILRLPSRDVFSGKGKLCLSANYLNKLNNAIDANNGEDVTSFHIVQTNSTKSNLIRDIQFLLDLINKTVSLKLIPDETKEYSTVDLSKFTKIKVLEIIKLDINVVTGLQKLRSQIQDLTCCKSLKYISDVLQKCGGDNSQSFNWNELKIAKFTHNNILEIDDSFERTLSLHTVDLSHNHLRNVNFTNILPNLKYLNISFNKLDSVPNFKGPIRNRLQVLVLNNNFIENIQELTSLSNLQQLDLGYNCLLDHKILLSISHLVSLQSLNLQGNPLGFHPYHRQLSCNFLNKNAATDTFLLDGSILNKSEKALTGSFYPVTQKLQKSSSSINSLESSSGSITKKPKKIRNVIIEENDVVKEVLPSSTPTTSSKLLEMKKQVEQLREEYGESWLYQDSGLIMQDVLGFKNITISSPTTVDRSKDPVESTQKNENDLNSGEILTIINESPKNGDISTNYDISEDSDDEDISSSGEDCMFLAINVGENNEVFVVVTESHISERDATTSKEKARWHINTILSCEKGDNNQIKLEFDTVRRDRKHRVYEINLEEIEAFYVDVRGKIESMKSIPKTDDNNLDYQCMKCSKFFKKCKSALLDAPLITCPYCTSLMVVEKV